MMQYFGWWIFSVILALVAVVGWLLVRYRRVIWGKREYRYALYLRENYRFRVRKLPVEDNFLVETGGGKRVRAWKIDPRLFLPLEGHPELVTVVCARTPVLDLFNLIPKDEQLTLQNKDKDVSRLAHEQARRVMSRPKNMAISTLVACISLCAAALIIVVAVVGLANHFGSKEPAQAAASFPLLGGLWQWVWGKPRPPSNQVATLDFYPEELGGITKGKMDKPPRSSLWRQWMDEVSGKRCFFRWYNPDTETLEPFRLPVSIVALPETYARVLGCEPVQRLKEIRLPMLEKISAGVAIGALIIAGLLFIVTVG